MNLRVLIACECSGVVRRAFRALGHDAWSCDVVPSEDNSPHHFECDALSVLNDGWDLLIAHPPCTYLTNAGVRHLHSIPSPNGVVTKVHGSERWKLMLDAAALFRAFLNAPIPMIGVENPIPHKYAVQEIGCTYTQLIQPWMFGHGETKATCLWLKNLPPLQPTHRKDDLFCAPEPTERVARIHLMPPSPNRARERSRTFPGIANAMAEQWGCLTVKPRVRNTTLALPQGA